MLPDDLVDHASIGGSSVRPPKSWKLLPRVLELLIDVSSCGSFPGLGLWQRILDVVADVAVDKRYELVCYPEGQE